MFLVHTVWSSSFIGPLRLLWLDLWQGDCRILITRQTEMIVNWLGSRLAFLWINNFLVSELKIFIFKISWTGAVILDVSKLPFLNSWREEKPAPSSQSTWYQAAPTPAGSCGIHTGPTGMLSSAVQQLLLDTYCKGNLLRSIIVWFCYSLPLVHLLLSTEISSKNVTEPRLCNSL